MGLKRPCLQRSMILIGAPLKKIWEGSRVAVEDTICAYFFWLAGTSRLSLPHYLQTTPKNNCPHMIEKLRWLYCGCASHDPPTNPDHFFIGNIPLVAQTGVGPAAAGVRRATQQHFRRFHVVWARLLRERTGLFFLALGLERREKDKPPILLGAPILTQRLEWQPLDWDGGSVPMPQGTFGEIESLCWL